MTKPPEPTESLEELKKRKSLEPHWSAQWEPDECLMSWSELMDQWVARKPIFICGSPLRCSEWETYSFRQLEAARSGCGIFSAKRKGALS